MSGGGFDYEKGVWGRESVRVGEHSVAGHTLARALADLPTRGRVLELGCGAGRMIGALGRARPGLARVGIDVSRIALDHAARVCPDLEIRHQADPGGPLPAGDGEFDAALVLDVLEHVDDPARVLGELRRVLKPGGMLHVHVPCEGDPRALWRWLPGGLGRLKRTYGGHVQRFRREDVHALLREAGFRLERERFSLHVLGNLADVVVFCSIALLTRLRRGRPALTTGDVMAGSRSAQPGLLGRMVAWGVRGVDFALWLEARGLGRIPSWCLHLSARRV